MTTSSVKAEPNNCGITKHIARTPGITKVGRGHNWRLAREMKDVFSRNIVSERLEVDVLGIYHSAVCQTRRPGSNGPHRVKPIVCHHLEVILLRNQWFVRMEAVSLTGCKHSDRWEKLI